MILTRTSANTVKDLDQIGIAQRGERYNDKVNAKYEYHFQANCQKVLCSRITNSNDDSCNCSEAGHRNS